MNIYAIQVNLSKKEFYISEAFKSEEKAVEGIIKSIGTHDYTIEDGKYVDNVNGTTYSVKKIYLND